MTDGNPHARWLRPLIIVGTVILTWSALLIGQQFTTVTVEVGEGSPETFLAESDFTIPDPETTDRLQREARAAVPPVYQRNEDVDTVVLENITELFVAVRDGTVVQGAEDLPQVSTTTTTLVEESTTTTEPQPTTTTEADEGQETTTTTVAETTTTTVPEVTRTASVSGSLFIDTNGDDLFDEGDHGLSDVRIVVYEATGLEIETQTDSDGAFVVGGLAEGETIVLIDTTTVPDRLDTSTDLLLRTVEVQDDLETPLEPLAFDVVVVDPATQELNLQSFGQLLSPSTVTVLVEIATEDVLRTILGRETWLTSVERETGTIAAEALNENNGILSEELDDAKLAVAQQSGILPLPDAPTNLWQSTFDAVTEIAAEFLQANKSIDQVQWEIEQGEAASAVPQAEIAYETGQTIVEQGDEITPLIENALQEAGVLTQAAPRYAALGAVVALVVALVTFYLGRFRPRVWGSMRRMALFGMMTVLSALSARLIAVFAMENAAVGYLIPAAAFGLMAAILFDARIAVLMSMVVGSMTAIATLDPGFTLFATLATLTPVPFVSSISARGELRMAVFYMIILLAALAGGVAWFFQDGATAGEAALYGALNGFLSGLVGSALLSFFEIIFDVTTSLRLLDLTDRNHPGLRLLEEKAIGTFNHSLMVGTLADRAARAVGANALLARAAAYYHDLGKTEHPQFFIENQFGIQNPHDRMPPEESANVIRQHVIDGRRLAKQFRIPADVADGVVTHHGDGIMHYFYGKAIERYGEERVDIEDYRHVGRKPETKEMAIVMMADSVEGACRAIFQEQEPSPQRISEVVERVVGEKVGDGQLSECSLTLGDLTRAKEAMVDALIGYYHQRIPYPNFPTGELEAGADDDPEADTPSLPAERPDHAPTE